MPPVARRLHDCLTGFPCAVLAVSAAGVVTDSNERLERRIGAALIGHPLTDILDDGSRSKWTRYLEAGAAASAAQTLELVFETKDALELIVFVPVWAAPGAEAAVWLIELPAGASPATTLDEIGALNAELVNAQRAAVRDRTRAERALERERAAHAAAATALRERDEILRIVAHDLRSPLATILTVAALLEDFDLPPERRAEQLQILRRTGRRMNQLINDLLDAARMEAGRLKVEPRELDVRTLMRELTDAFASVAADKGLTVVNASSGRAGLPVVNGDHDRLLQALSNLVGNAVSVTPAGGRIVLDAQVRERTVRFTVQDTGPGIPAAHLDKLFAPFWQGERRRTTGAGLGLSIARGIAEAHGGDIGVASVEGEGATFWITLPLAAGADEHPADTPPG